MGEVPPQFKKFLFKKGQSGNPSGRPKDTMKQYAREFLLKMTDDERIDFLNSIDPDIVWRMAEGNPPQDVRVAGEIKLPLYLPSSLIEKNELSPGTGKNSEGSAPVQGS